MEQSILSQVISSAMREAEKERLALATLDANLKTIQEQEGYTQLEIARRIGLKPSTLCRWHRGNRQPTTQDSRWAALVVYQWAERLRQPSAS